MNQYLNWIDEQITHHEREIAKLTIAKEVIMHIDSSIKPKHESKPKHRTHYGNTFAKVLDVLREPMTSREIINAVREQFPTIKEKSIVNVLYNAHRTNRLILDKKQRKYSTFV